MKKVIWTILNKLHIGGPFQLAIKSGLIEDGWFKSFYSKSAIDRYGNPLPWCTYSFVKFLEKRITSDYTIFEYGSGNSTLWYASKAKNVIAVENDLSWYEKIRKIMPPNVQLYHRDLKEGNRYVNTIKEFNDLLFDIIIIDGRKRVECIKTSVEKLSNRGVIVLDNSERSEYVEGINWLVENGFKKIEFYGLAPIVPLNTETTIFYRTHNCLNI